MHEEYRSCIEACVTCAEECEHCTTACLQEPDAAQRARCVGVLRDCADICVESVRWMARGSSFARPVCELCADICEPCAAECARFKDEHCRRCAEACRECARECRTMAGRATAGTTR